MRLRSALFLFTITTCSLISRGQNMAVADTAQYPYWADMMQQPGVHFATVQRAFNLYWQNREITKGSGWKPFKRWEYYWQDRLDSNGNIPPADEVWKAFYHIKSENTGNPLEQKSDNDIQYKGDAGNWKPLGPGLLPKNNVTVQPNGLGRVNAIAFHPTDSNIIYVGAPAGGFWISEDYGKTWRTTTDSLPTLGVSAIAVNPSNPNIIYIGTGDRDNNDSYGYGILKSTDGGETWFVSNNGMGSQTVGKLLINPTSPSTLLAATAVGVYISTNAGNTWAKTSATGNYKDLVYKPGDYNIVYATENGNFYRSTNGGNSFTKISSGLSAGQRGVIGVTPHEPDYVYFLQSSGNVYKATYLSTNSGLNFSTRSTTPNILGYEADGSGTTGQGWYDLCIAVDPYNKDIVYAGGINIFKSTDGGLNWQINAHWTGNSSVPVHADQHILLYSPVSQHLYVGNDGGIYYTNNNGATWNDISSGIAISQIYRMGQDAKQRKLIINGYQDNGTAYNNEGEWTTIRGGDGMDCIVDYSNPSILIASVYYGNFGRYINGKYEGIFAANGSGGITETGGWVTPIIQSNANPNVYFAGYKNLWRTTNAQDAALDISWAQITNKLGGSNSAEIRVLEQCANNPDILYLARSDFKFFRSDNINAGTPTYTDLTSKLPATGTVACIETTPANANRVYIGLGKKIYRSDNKGSNWTDITANIPNLKINTIVIDTSSSIEEIYVGTDAGVYYTNHTLTGWVYFNTGLPLSVNVTELEIFYNPLNPSNAKLRAATYGRGMWESDLYKTGAEKPVTHFVNSQTETCINTDITFEDNTGNIPTGWKWVFTPPTVTYINGTTDTSQNITIRPNAGGNYTVSLITANANGADTFTQTGAIYAYDTARRMCNTSTTFFSGFGIGIFNVEVANINNASEGADQNGSYEDYGCNQIAFLKPDTTYTISITTGNNNNEYVKVFIDYNNDGDFKDAGELVYNGPSAFINHNGSFKTPKNPVLNRLLRMRVISDFSSIGSPDCPSLDYGQSEDYNVFFDFPNANYTVNKSSICLHDTVVFATTQSGKIKSLVWDFGVGAVPQTATGVGPFRVYYTSPGYKKIKKALNGGVATETDSAVFVADLPKVSFFAHDTLQCVVNRTINLVNNTTISAGPLTYWWNFGDGTTATTPHYFKQYNVAGVYTVTLKATGNMGCTDSLTTQVKVSNSGINSSFTVDSADKCFNNNRFLFTNTTAPPPGITVNYKWDFGDFDTAHAADTISHSYNTVGPYTVKLIVASTQGCEDSAVSPVEVHPHPTASFSIVPASMCEGGIALMQNSSSILAGSLTYKWDLGNGNIPTATHPADTFKTGGLFLIKLIATSNKGCSHSTTQTLQVWAKPQASFTKQFITHNTVKFTPGVSGYPNYSWDFGDSSKQTDPSPTHQYTKQGTYSVTLDVTSNEGCNNTNTDTVTIYNTGAPEPATTYAAIVQPNPFDNSIDVYFSHTGKENIVVYLTDILGRKVLSIPNNSTQTNEFKATTATGHLAKGVYFVVIETNNSRQTVKVIK